VFTLGYRLSLSNSTLPKTRDDHLNLTEPDGLRLMRSSARRTRSPKSHHASGRYQPEAYRTAFGLLLAAQAAAALWLLTARSKGNTPLHPPEIVKSLE